MSGVKREKRSVIAEYLGEGADLGGPFALLGLKHSPIDEEMILRACQVRLVKIGEHARANTPRADEVRMAVHTAASQLLDPELREELAKHWGEGVPVVEGVSPEAWDVEPGVKLDDRLRRQALMLLGACGGWNAKSRKRLGQFARMNRLSAAQLVAGIVGDFGGGVDGDSGRADRMVRGPSLIDPAEGALPWALIPALYVCMGLVLVWAGVARHDGGGVEVIEPAGQSSGVVMGGRGSETQKKEDSTRRHFSAVLFELEQIRLDGVFDVEGGERFSAVGERLLEQWTEFGVEDLDRAVDAVGGVFAGILNPDVFGAASGFLVVDGGTEEPVLAGALRVWLSGSVDRAPLFGGLVDPAGFEGALGNSFEHASGLGVDDERWWAWWIGQLGAMGERDGDVAQSLMLGAVYGRLVEELDGEEWEKSARLIVRSLDWGLDERGAGTRSWLMGVVVDPQVRSDRLAVLTRAMVVHSSAAGLGVEMVTGDSDSMEQRELYLGSLRERWVAGEGAGDDLREQLVQRIGLMLKLSQGSMSRSQAMDRGVELARVNSACWARSRDDEVGLLLLMGMFDSPVETAGSAGVLFDLSSSDEDELWATDARNLEEQGALFGHLDLLHRVDPIGPKSAHALVYLAMQAPDLEVRARAEDVMMGRRDEPAILIALDRVAGAKRTTRRMTELILGYVGAGGTADEAGAVRRLILERLAEVGVLGGETGIGNFSRVMGELFGSRAGSEAVEGARGFYEALVLDLMKRGEDVPSDVRVRLLVRLRAARGGMQGSLAYQSAGMELFADGVGGKYPAQAGRVERVLKEGSARLRVAGDVVEQMAIVERMIAELWLIVLESEGMS